MTVWWHGGLLSHSSIQWPQWMNTLQILVPDHWYKNPKLLNKKLSTVTPKTSRVSSLLRIEGDVFFFFFVWIYVARPLMISFKFACKWRHQPVRVPGASGPPRCQKAKSISRPLPSCPSMHFIGTTLPLCSPALFPNELIAKKKKEEKKILLALSKQSSLTAWVYHRGCFKVIFFYSIKY